MLTIYTDLTKLKADLQAHPDRLPNYVLDNLAYTAQLADKPDLQEFAAKAILEYAPRHNIHTHSIHNLYMAFANGELSGFTVPALNVRTLTYDFSQMVHQHMMEKYIGPVIFEIALSEQEYTSQTHLQYASSIVAGAMKAHYTGPIFLLGDHYQLKASVFKQDKESELARLKVAIRKAIAAQFYNIDIDGSTLVNLDLPYTSAQQKDNYEATAHLAQFIRRIQPEQMTVAIGAEIGHIGGVNSTPEDFQAFIDGFKKIVSPDIPGLAKIAIQTGTEHGGTINQDGSLAQVTLDTKLHRSIGVLARENGIGGTVQHGASTLPLQAFHTLPESTALEVHLSTGWQNIVFDHMPTNLRESIYNWLQSHLQSERKPGMSHDQFIYKTRKKSLGQFKKDLWKLSATEKAPILHACLHTFDTMCTELRVNNTREILNRYIHE